MTTVPGFSSRTPTTTIRQFPARDEAAMSEMTPGWSNSDSQPTDQTAVVSETDSKVVEPSTVEDKTVTTTTPARKSAARKKS